MDLLTPAEKAQIQQGLLDAMGTLHQTDVVLYIKNVSLDLRQINTNASYNSYNLKSIVKEKRKVNDEGVKGSRDINNVEFKFHRQDFIDLMLIGLSGQLLFNSSETVIGHKGKTFRVVSLEVEDIAVRVQAEHTPILIPQESIIPQPPQPPTDCPSVLSYVAPYRYSCLIPSLDYAVGNDADFNAFNQQQKDDLTLRLTPPSLMQSLSFDGMNENVFAPNYSELNFDGSTPFTISFWVKPLSFSGTRALMSKRFNLGAGWSITFNGNQVIVNLVNTEVTAHIQVRFTLTVAANTWWHGAVTYNGSKLASGVKLYENSISLVSTTLIGTLGSASIASTALLALGRNSQSGSQYFQGRMSITRAWGIEFSPAQVITDYNGGSMLSTPMELGNLLFGWRGGQGALYGNGVFVFPCESGLHDSSLPYSSLVEYADVGSDIP